MIPKFSHRFSTSDLPNTSLQNVDYATKIPQPIYTKSRDTEQSPLMSPTYSVITENRANELNVLEKEDFKVNKKIPL